MKICVVGLGYIGFPTACLFAQAGHQVVGVDVNPAVVDALNRRELHLVNEEGLAQVAFSVLESGALRVQTKPESADAFVLAVPTPFTQEEASGVRAKLERRETAYHADLSYVENAASSIAPYLQPGNLVILESTVPPGTTERNVLPTLRKHGVDTDALLVAHAPERVLPGRLIHELVYNDRIVGGVTEEASAAAKKLYSTFVKGNIVTTSATTAELVKLMENTYRDVNIALANEMARVCDYLGVDVWEAIRLANMHPRVNFHRPGPGVGGHCIAVDPYFIVEVAPHLTKLIQAARRVNRLQPLHVVDLLERVAAGGTLRRIAILGAAYKADVGDDRESPSLEIAELLREKGYEVRVHDYYVGAYAVPLEDVVSGADAILLLTDHHLYRDLDPHQLASRVARRLVLDTRAHLDRERWESAGFTVHSLGDGRTTRPMVGVAD